MEFDFDAGPTPRRPRVIGVRGRGRVEAAVTAEAEARDVLETTGAHYLLPPHHQLEDVDVAVVVGEEEDQVDVCTQFCQGAV